MSQGKFSNPRPHRDEERQIEQAFRQLTGQEPPKEPEPQIFEQPIPEATPAEFGTEFEQSFESELDALLQQPAAPVRGAYEKTEPAPSQPPVREYHPENVPFEDSFDDGNQDLLDKIMDFVQKNKKLVAVCLCAAALLLLVLVGSIFFFGGSSSDNGAIYDNIYIADIHVGGLTKSEAISLVKQATSGTYTQQDMVIDLSGTEIRLSPKNTKAALDAKAAVEAAYAYGRTGTDEEQEQAQLLLRVQSHTIAVLPYLELDEEYILNTLTTYAEDTGSTLTQTTYGLEGNQPALDAESFDQNAPTQKLVFTIGTPGIGFDAQDVYEQVLDAYSLHKFLVSVENVESVKDPDPVDLEAVYEEFYIAPKNATVDMRTFEIIPGSYGYGFDLEAARKLLDKAEFGEELSIQMEYIEPDILDEDMFYQDELGAVRLSYSSSKNRNTNLRLACESINGLVLNPGETFSFNDTVGQRNSANGFKSALEDLSDEDADEVTGGGIGQVASALYQCALISDLQITYRVAQDLVPDYTEAGLDVSVGWRSPDFQFTNSTSYPIQILAEADGGNVSIQILGTDERQYYVELEVSRTATDNPGTKYETFEFDNDEGYEDGDVIREGIAGVTVKSYKYKYDKATGELISKDYIATSQYTRVDKIVARVEPEETTEPTTEPATEPETEPETEPPTRPTEKPTEPSVEPTPPPTMPAETTPKAETEPEIDTISDPEVTSAPEPLQADVLPEETLSAA